MRSTKEIARNLGLIRKRSTKLFNPANNSRQIFQFLIIIDFESTCWEEDKYKAQEIIEFPAVLLNVGNGNIEDEFRYYLQPQEYPILSSFCTKLTGITQNQVDDGIPLFLCLRKFQAWLQKMQLLHNFTLLNNLNVSYKGAFVTWSDWDLGRCLNNECRRKQLRKPIELNSWIDLRATYRKFYNRKPQGLRGALQEVGIKFEGREHSGLDDAKNTAFLAYRMVKDGCLLLHTKIDTNIQPINPIQNKVQEISENILNDLENVHPNIINIPRDVANLSVSIKHKKIDNKTENVNNNQPLLSLDNIYDLNNTLTKNGNYNNNNNNNNNNYEEYNDKYSYNSRINLSQQVNTINGNLNGEVILNDLELLIHEEWFNNEGLIWDEKSCGKKCREGSGKKCREGNGPENKFSSANKVKYNTDILATNEQTTDKCCFNLLNKQCYNKQNDIKDINNLSFNQCVDKDLIIKNDKNFDILNDEILLGLQEELNISFNQSLSVEHSQLKNKPMNQSIINFNNENSLDNESFNQSLNQLLSENINQLLNDSFNSTFASPPSKKKKVPTATLR